MPRTGENIYKRKDGRWEGRYIKGHRPDGRTMYGYVYGYTYKDVKEKLRSVAIRKTNQPTQKAATVTIAQLSEQWLTGQKSRVKESTFNKYSNLLRLNVIPYIGDLDVEIISYQDVAHLCDELLQHGGVQHKGLSSKTVADTMSVIKNILHYSLQIGYQNSFDTRLIRIKQSTHELRVLSPSEQNTLYMYLSDSLSTNNMGILICMLTGLRIGEVCALRWEDISFADHTIHVNSTMQRIQDKSDPGPKTKIIITQPKSVSGKRLIPMPKNLEEILLNWSSVRTGFVLSSNGSSYTEPRVLQYHFKNVTKDLGIQQVNFHALRHTFATRCIEIGFDVKSLSEILGHSSVSITMNRYVHPSLDLKRENMQRLSAVFAVK